MSLIHWWPLTANTTDYGTNFTLLSQFSGEETDNGKLGKCYKSTTHSGRFSSSQLDGKSISYACWVKFNKSEIQTVISGLTINSTYTTPCGNIVGNCNYGGVGLMWSANNIYNDGSFTTLSIFGYIRNSSQEFYLDCSGFDVAFDTWYHVALVFDRVNKTFVLYKNGEMIGTPRTFSTQPALIANDFYVNVGWVHGGNGPGTSIPIYMNDIRIYDHALSAKEVKEISKGLVLHYTFEDPYIEGTTNRYAYSGDNPYWSQTFYDGATGQYGYNDNSNAQYEYVTALDKYGNQKKMVKVSLRTARSTYPYVHFDYLSGEMDNHTYATVSFDMFSTCATSISPYSYYSGYYFSYWDDTTKQWVGGTSTQVVISGLKTNQWNHIVFRIYRDTTDYSSGPGYCPVGSSSSTSDYWLFDNVQVEGKDHATPYVNGTRSAGIVYDSSGYGNDAVVYGSPQIIADSTSGQYSMKFDGASAVRTSNFYLDNEWSYGCWIKSASSSRSWEGVIIQNTNGGDADMQLGVYTYPTGSVIQSTANGQYNSNISYTYNNTWNHFFATFDGTNLKTYINGQLVDTKTITNSLLARNIITIGARYRGGSSYDCYFLGNVNDVKFYATVLSASDILAEYNRKASMDKSGNLFSGYFKEHDTTPNLLEKANYAAITAGGFDSWWQTIKEADYAPSSTAIGVHAYTQGNLSVTSTVNGYRLYSEPNRDGRAQEGSEWNTWGGLVLDPMHVSRCLVKGHHYRISWHVSGQSTRAMEDCYWSNNIGWGQSPDASPTVHEFIYQPADFQGEMDCVYDFTIEDDIFKTIGSNPYNTSFLPNTSYLAYAGFKIGYSYGYTGTLGTDVYITNIQMHDLTSDKIYKIGNNGVIKSTEFVSGKRSAARLHSDGVMDVTDLIEN